MLSQISGATIRVLDGFDDESLEESTIVIVTLGINRASTSNLPSDLFQEKALVFDLGLGAETFKERFATHTPLVRTWELYPSGSLGNQAKRDLKA